MRILLVLCLIIFIGGEVEAECIDYFTGSTSSFDFLVISSFETPESTAVGTELVIIGYDTNTLEAPQLIEYTQTEDGCKYLDGVDNGTNIVVSVKESMERLPDFPESVVNLLMEYYFQLKGQDEYCRLQIRVEVTDENNQTPTTDQDYYSYTVREDYPVMLTIPNLQIEACDLDYSVPNNQLTVTFQESDCPLETDEPTYTPVQGQNVSVTFHLKNKVDYDSMISTNDITCSGAVTDGGINQLKKEFSLILTVDQFSDEPPRFEYPLYSTELKSLDTTGLPLSILPAEIKATDGDKDVIEYSMEAYDDSDQWNDFFTIDSSTAEVTQVKDIPSDMVQLGEIFFIVKASDGTSPNDTTVLQIVLPEIEITTIPMSSTTEGTQETCPPCTTESITCPTYTTDPTTYTTDPTTYTTDPPTYTTDPTLCPSCPTESTYNTESSECPTCTTEFTCPPCSTFSSSDTPSTGESSSSSTDDATYSTEMPNCPTCDPCDCTTITLESTTTDITTDSEVTSPHQPTTYTPSQPPTCMFERSAYHYQVYVTTLLVDTLKVVPKEGYSQPENVKYRWETVTVGNMFIILDQNTGQITLDTDNAVDGNYNLVALATVDQKQEISTEVSILVQAVPNCGDVTLSFGVLQHDIREDTEAGEKLLKVTDDEGRAKGFCIQGTEPFTYKDYFSIDDNGVLTLEKTIDADKLPGDSIRIRIHASEKPITEEECPSNQGNLLRNEGYVSINVEDINDEAPVILKPSESSSRFGYPVDISLQQVVGPVLTVEMADLDSVGELSVSLTGADATHFLEETIYYTSSIYLTEPEACTEECHVIFKAFDGVQSSAEKEIYVTSLPMDDIYTLEFTNLTSTEIENTIQDISNSQNGTEIRILYMTVLEVEDGEAGRQISRRKPRALPKEDGGEKLTKSHIYGFTSDGSLLNMDDMNEVLESESLKAETYSEKAVFAPPPGGVTNTTGFVIASVFATLVVILIIVAVALFVLNKKGHVAFSKEPKRKGDRFNTTRSNTVGSGYAQESYKQQPPPSSVTDSIRSTDREIKKPSNERTSSRDKVTTLPEVQVGQNKETPITSSTAVPPTMNKEENNSPSTTKSSKSNPSGDSSRRAVSFTAEESSESGRKTSDEVKFQVDF